MIFHINTTIIRALARSTHGLSSGGDVFTADVFSLEMGRGKAVSAIDGDVLVADFLDDVVALGRVIQLPLQLNDLFFAFLQLRLWNTFDINKKLLLVACTRLHQSVGWSDANTLYFGVYGRFYIFASTKRPG